MIKNILFFLMTFWKVRPPPALLASCLAHWYTIWFHQEWYVSLYREKEEPKRYAALIKFKLSCNLLVYLSTNGDVYLTILSLIQPRSFDHFFDPILIGVSCRTKLWMNSQDIYFLLNIKIDVLRSKRYCWLLHFMEQIIGVTTLLY